MSAKAMHWSARQARNFEVGVVWPRVERDRVQGVGQDLSASAAAIARVQTGLWLAIDPVVFSTCHLRGAVHELPNDASVFFALIFQNYEWLLSRQINGFQPHLAPRQQITGKNVAT